MIGWVAGVLFAVALVRGVLEISRRADADEACKNIVGVLAEQANDKAEAEADKEISENLNV